MREFPELIRTERLLESNSPLLSHRVLATVTTPDHNFPIHAITIGETKPDLPTFGLFAGVHGLEKIGTHVCLSFLENLLAQLTWDKQLQRRFDTMRIVAIPVINPVGMFMNRRSNYNRVDLMRNAPIEKGEGRSYFLGSGHRLSPYLPWYRGPEGAPMELESQTLINFLEQEMFPAPLSLALDLHSGYGIQDSLWYPYGTRVDDFPFKPQALAIASILNKTLPHHVYKITAQSDDYVVAGDLWDYALMKFCDQARDKNHMFLPWTLEMGSWVWVKKNPFQVLSSKGLFNPIQKHRFARIMRRHLLLLQFFAAALQNSHAWVSP